MLNQNQAAVGGLGEVWIDRRLEDRNEIRFTLFAILLTGPERRRIAIETLDLNSRGIGFFSPMGFELGDYFAVRLHLAAQPSKLILCRTMFTQKKKSGMYRIGAEFLESIPSETNLEIPPAWLKLAQGIE